MSGYYAQFQTRKEYTMSTSLEIASLFVTAFLLLGCEEKSIDERTGEAIDNAADEFRDSGENMADEIENACEEDKEGVVAGTTIC